jgi:fatty acid desaturase
MKPKFFAHSKLDSLLVGLAFVHLGLLTFGVLTVGSAPWGVSVALGLISIYLMSTNYQVTGHNFVHNPFFASKRLNAVFSVFNSLPLGVPQSLYRVHHLHHHKYNNDAPDPATGTTKDFTSTWRYSKLPGEEEPVLPYAVFGFFRIDVGILALGMRKLRLQRMVVWEVSALLAMMAVFGVLNPLGFVAFYLPVWMAGTVASQAENWFEHYGAIPGDRLTDAVSSYGWFYNLIRFNNGYHQEHHFRPRTHWTRLPEIKKLMRPETERHVVRGAHWFNLCPRRIPVVSAKLHLRKYQRVEEKRTATRN